MITFDQKGFNVTDLMGNHYLFCDPFDAGIEVIPTHLTYVTDDVYCRIFLLELCRIGSLSESLRDLYKYARPHNYQLHKLSDWDIIDQLIHMLVTEELKVWQLKDGLWDNAPEHIGIDVSMAGSSSGQNQTSKQVSGVKKAPVVSNGNVDDKPIDSQKQPGVYEPSEMMQEGRSVAPNTRTLGGAASKSGGVLRGEIPHQTEKLWIANKNGPRTFEDMVDFIDEKGAFNGNIIDYEIKANNLMLVDHGGGLKVNYRIVPDKVFEKHYGSGFASYNKQVRFREDEPIDFQRMFHNEHPTVFVRESMLSSDRGAFTVFRHEYTEIQGLWNRLNQRTMYPADISNLIDDLHVQAVNSGDKLLRDMISDGAL